MCDLIRKLFRPSDIDKFKKDWRNSSAAQLLLPDINTVTLELGKVDGFLASIGYLAWVRSYIYRLDRLVNKFDIPKKATANFKKRLEEDWLGKDPAKRRKSCHNTVSALSEIVVADYLKNLCYNVTDLEAWNNSSCDIEYKDTQKHKFYVEVKYLADPPDWYDARIEAAATGETPIIHWLDEEILNYAFYRIAEAAIQLEKKGISENDRVVWLIVDTLATGISRPTIDCQFSAFTAWYSINGTYPGIPEPRTTKEKEKRDRILRTSPNKWVQNAARIVLSTMDCFQLYYIKCLSSNASYP